METLNIAKKILLVYPKIPTTYWSMEYALPFIGASSLQPPLGLITVAALLPQNYELRLTDLNVSVLKEEDILWADMVFISAMLVQQESFDEVVQWCNRLQVPVAAGGPYPTNSYQDIKGVSHFILNEGEITLPQFLADYEKGQAKAIYLDVTKPDVNQTPIPRFDLIDISKYLVLTLQASRGCPFNCEFCDIIEMFGQKPRYKNPTQFLAELDAVYQTGFRGPLFIVDDNFIGNPQRVKELLIALKEWQLEHDRPFSFFTETSINLANNDQILKLMQEVGFDQVFVGIETPDTDLLAQTQKNQNTRFSLLESVDTIQRHGIEVLAGFILGFDNEQENIFDRMIEFIDLAALPVSMVGILMVLPNTQLHRRLIKEGRLLGATNGNNTHQIDINYIPTMDKNLLIDGYEKVISDIYTPKKYFQRCLNLIKKYPKKRINVKKRDVSLKTLPALFKSLAKQGFSSYSAHYFRFLFKVLVHNPKDLATGITFAVRGYHFFKITAEIQEVYRMAHTFSQLLHNLDDELKSMSQKGVVITKKFVDTRAGRIRRISQKKFKRSSKKIQIHLVKNYDEFEMGLQSIVNKWHTL